MDSSSTLSGFPLDGPKAIEVGSVPVCGAGSVPRVRYRAPCGKTLVQTLRHPPSPVTTTHQSGPHDQQRHPPIRLPPSPPARTHRSGPTQADIASADVASTATHPAIHRSEPPSGHRLPPGSTSTITGHNNPPEWTARPTTASADSTSAIPTCADPPKWSHPGRHRIRRCGFRPAPMNGGGLRPSAS